MDSIINFKEDLPEDELENGFRHAQLADLCIVLGSSLRVYPAADMPGNMIERGARVVIVNLQKTPLNKKCSMEVHSTIDDLVLGVMKRLGLEVPSFRLKRCFAVDVTTDSLTIQGLDPFTKSLTPSLKVSASSCQLFNPIFRSTRSLFVSGFLNMSPYQKTFLCQLASPSPFRAIMVNQS